MADPAVIVEKLLNYISTTPVSTHQIVCKTKLHNQTVKKYLQIIEDIQNSPKLKKEVRGIRVLFRKES
jgi:DNA invertase Pin-like site-specific DNA recombinase